MRIFWLFVTLFAISQAVALSGVELYSFCAAEEDTAASLACSSYVRGFTDGIMAGTAAATENVLCPPAEGINALQARLIVERFLRDHPEGLHIEAGLLVMRAFMEAFRCNGISN
jgi:hypothetical protein